MSACKGWLQLTEEDAARIRTCGVEKLKEGHVLRRCTGGILTAVTSCGLLVDWLEPSRGESIELVYMFVLRLHRAACDLGLTLRCIGYDNACKLLALARAKRNEFVPWTESLVGEVRMVLDKFHRSNHTWCLRELPEVDPCRPENADLVAEKNTQACEQLNSWIRGRTSSGLEMARGHCSVDWWGLFERHNDWVEEGAACNRRRFAKGGMARDPDKPSHRQTAPS